MQSADVYRQVAQLHASNIDQGFLSSLGTPFLALLYEAIDATDSSVLLVAKDQEKVVGFVSGAEGMRSIYRQLIRRWPRLVWALLPALLSPPKLMKIVEILLLGKKSPPSPNLPQAELMSIAVDPSQRGKGHAIALYIGLAEHFRQRGLTGFKIVVGEPLAAAHRFYTKMGAVPLGRMEVHKGQVSLIYLQELGTDK